MTEDLRHDLLELAPSMDLPNDFYDNVMKRARRRQRGMRAATAGVAAAVIAGIVVGSTTLTDASSVDRLVPTTPTPSPQAVVPVPTPSPSAHSSAAAHATSSPTSHTSAIAPSPDPSSTSVSSPAAEAPTPSTVMLGGAFLTLPAGWVAEELAPSSAGSAVVPTWCLMPQSGPVPSSADAPGCTIAFKAIPTGAGQPEMSVDTPGGLVGNPEFCPAPQSQSVSIHNYLDHKLGDRAVAHRTWFYVCQDGSRRQVEQYVADYAPAFVLYSSQATATVSSELASIAKTAALPAATSRWPLSIFAIVGEVNPAQGGVHIKVQWAIRGPAGPILVNAYDEYGVPTSALPAGRSFHVGDRVELHTNGSAVTSVQFF